MLDEKTYFFFLDAVINFISPYHFFAALPRLSEWSEHLLRLVEKGKNPTGNRTVTLLKHYMTRKSVLVIYYNREVIKELIPAEKKASVGYCLTDRLLNSTAFIGDDLMKSLLIARISKQLFGNEWTR